MCAVSSGLSVAIPVTGYSSEFLYQRIRRVSLTIVPSNSTTALRRCALCIRQKGFYLSLDRLEYIQGSRSSITQALHRWPILLHLQHTASRRFLIKFNQRTFQPVMPGRTFGSNSPLGFRTKLP
ncbi:hypothetical protein CDAR_416831 [Caerostris darwini]|uniref:Uncharacterized protein n=1 Tax=Caerostris darwini TaxID=1538125 RepID=A0AAV4X8K1_9ARAC|nr:hypothetical protein CDAR_416831 [Caerostris darwini]